MQTAPDPGAPRAASVDALSGGLFVAAAVAVYARLYFGVDFTDESFYSALPHAFLLGHRPVLDEIALHQFAGLMLLPAVKLHLALVGSSEGLVLFMRHLYFVCALLCSALVASRLGRVVGLGVALQLSALLLVDVPFSIPSPSYNTLARFGLLLGLVWIAFSGSSPRPGRDLFLGSLALGAACFAYPPLLLAVLPALLWACLWLRDDGERPQPLWRIAVPIGLAGSIWLALVAWLVQHWGGPAALSRLLEFSRTMAQQGGGGDKLFAILLELAREQAMLISMAALALAAALVFRRVRRPGRQGALLLLAGPGLLLAARLQDPVSEPYTTTGFFVSTLGAISLLALWPGRSGRPPGVDGRLAWIAGASLLAGACVLWASANGLRNAALGLAPASLVGLVLVTGAAGTGRPAAAHRSVPLFMASLLIYGVLDLYAGVYRDRPIPELRQRIERGPYAGLFTHPERAAFVGTLGRDLERARVPGSSILFFDYFPAGYLFVDMAPATPALWMFPSDWQLQGNEAIREIYARHFDDPAALPDVAVVMRRVPFRDWVDLSLQPDDPVLRSLPAALYEPLIERPAYQVLRRRSGARPSLAHSM